MGFVEDISRAIELTMSCIEPAKEATRNLLFPFELRNWMRITLVVFLGSYLLNFNMNFNMPSDINIQPVTLGVLALLIFGLVVGMAVISSVFNFVFLNVLLKDERPLPELANKNLGNGLQLLGFTFALMVPLALVVLLFIGGGLLMGVQNNPLILFPLVLAALIVLLPLIFIFGFIQQLTTQYVTLIMVLQKVGIVDGWKQLLKMMSGRFTYWGVAMTLLGIIGGLVGLIPVIILMVPMVLMSLVLLFMTIIVGAVLTMVPVAVAQLLIVLSALILIAVIFLLGYIGTAVFLPIPVFIRYLSIFFFKKFSETFKFSFKGL